MIKFIRLCVHFFKDFKSTLRFRFINFISLEQGIMFKTANLIAAEKVEGDYLEFGVYSGGSFIEAFNTLKHAFGPYQKIHGERTQEDIQELNRLWNNMRFFAFDSFEGLPNIEGIDKHGKDFAKGKYYCSETNFLKNLSKAGVAMEKVSVVSGLFEKTCIKDTKDKFAIKKQGLNISSHSYGSTQTCGLNGAGVIYTATSRATDLNLNNFPHHLHAHSAGNSQTACTGGWSTITASGKSAKNNILVANITTLEALSGSSSCGPVQDGRVKPEISAFGSSVFSTSTPLNGYATLSGTSMATPGVAGSLALLVQRYKQLNGDALPPSTLIKNTVLNTAHDLGNVGPDYRFGYGRPNALQAVRILEDNRYALNTVTTGTSNDIVVNVPAGSARLRVMLTWNDPGNRWRQC